MKNSALILIDVINDFNFPDAEKLLRYALPAAHALATLRKRLKKQGIPVIYVNDNFGRWQSDFKEQITRCSGSECIGREVVKLLLTENDDYFVLKPMHSGFYSTSLDVLLRYLDVRNLIITGFAGDMCVVYTANDAYMRQYELIVPSDCIASETEKANLRALDHMRLRLKARVVLSTSLR